MVALLTKSTYLSFACAILFRSSLFAQVQPDLAKPSIDEIINDTRAQKEESASVITQVETPLRETPGIISILTTEDIKQSGARDLMELLTLLPGFSFAHDVNNVLGINTRGLWGHEGKVMVLVDGHLMNETSFGVFPFAQHITLDNIQRIEISRGPGSAIYGGVAGLAVLNITTKSGEQLMGGTFSQSIGRSEGNLSRQVTTANFGTVYNSGLSVAIQGTLNRTNQSNSLLMLSNGNRISYADSSAINTAQFGIKTSYKGLNANFLYDDYNVRYSNFTGKSVFEGYYFNSNYTFHLSDKWTIVPAASFKHQQPWAYQGVPGGDEINTVNWRMTTSARTFYKVSDNINLLGGLEYYQDAAKFTNDSTRKASPEFISKMHNFAAFAQGIIKTDWFNITAGFRFDNHNIFGSAFVPRIALTRVTNRWHQKVVINYAFKAPLFINLNANRDIKPERINSFDLEVGYTAPAGISVTANFFITEIDKPIIYFSPNGIINNYRSGEPIGSSGFELTAGIKKQWGGLKTNYFYYRALSSNESYFFSPDTRSIFLGSPNQKWILQTYFNINKNFSVTVNSTLSEGNTAVGDLGKRVDVGPSFQSNLILTHHHFLLQSLRFSIGAYNIFNNENWYPQAYRGNISPIPGMGPELVIKIAYSFKEN
jgi:outer membrane cobalamin receptor